MAEGWDELAPDARPSGEGGSDLRFEAIRAYRPEKCRTLRESSRVSSRDETRM